MSVLLICRTHEIDLISDLVFLFFASFLISRSTRSSPSRSIPTKSSGAPPSPKMSSFFPFRFSQPPKRGRTPSLSFIFFTYSQRQPSLFPPPPIPPPNPPSPAPRFSSLPAQAVRRQIQLRPRLPPHALRQSLRLLPLPPPPPQRSPFPAVLPRSSLSAPSKRSSSPTAPSPRSPKRPRRRPRRRGSPTTVSF